MARLNRLIIINATPERLLLLFYSFLTLFPGLASESDRYYTPRLEYSLA
jgi:hypothetical protein